VANSYSLTFGGVDLSIYNLVVTSHDLPIDQKTSTVAIKDKSIAGRSSLLENQYSLDVAITADSLSDLLSNLDNVKKALNTQASSNLILDMLDDRYWVARFQGLHKKSLSPGLWEGYLDFLIADPLAHDTSETTSNHNIDADPKTVIEAVGGTANTEPVFTLTAGEDLNDVTITLLNVQTGLALSWTGSIANGEELEIDVEHWTVKLEGTDDMADVAGEFPYLIAGSNSIKVTGFGSLGSLGIKYRNRYL